MMSGYDRLNKKKVLTVDGRCTVNLLQRRQLAVYSGCVEPQPQRLGGLWDSSRGMTVSLVGAYAYIHSIYAPIR